MLAEQGLSGFTLKAVAETTGIHYGNLTHHYATREILIEGMFDFLAERYRLRFEEMVERVASDSVSVRDVVAWLLDDAVSARTAPLFLQLWAMASTAPEIAQGMARLYDQAVSSFMEAYGLAPHAPHAKGLRDALYLLGTVIEGSSAIFWTRDSSGAAFAATARGVAIETLTGIIEARLAEARAAS